MLGRLFVDHPRSLGLSWLEHGAGAVRIGGQMIAAGAACVVHAIVPGLFTQTAGRTVERLYQHMANRRASTDNWPDYEI
jgi:hypothetical protein